MLIGTYNAQYIGKTMGGFVNKQDYYINIDKDDYGYSVEGVMNLTKDVATNAYLRYASENSIRRNWDFERGNV